MSDFRGGLPGDAGAHFSGHLSERAIVELRDGALLDADSGIHLDGCEVCRNALEEAKGRADTIGAALAELEEPFDVGTAREAVRARLAGGRSTTGPGRDEKRSPSFWTLGRAATFLLVTTGALSALPGSPVRDWIGGPPPQLFAPSEMVRTMAVEPVGMRMTVEDGPVVVRLDQVPSGTVIEVRWLAEPSLAVRAAPGSSFTSAEGRVQATIAGGPVSVELPGSIDEASLTVNGRVYLRGAPGGLDVTGPVDARDTETIRFIVR